jgi:hypothetical protein
MPSLPKTLRMCHSTVRGLLLGPSRAVFTAACGQMRLIRLN